MGETYSDYINRNLGMAQGSEQISSNRTAKFTTQATRQLMPSGSLEPAIEQIISGDSYNHNGRDLTEVFTEEQLDFDTPWDWLQARIDAEDFSGLMIGDYIPLVIDEKDWKAVIIGINTYKGMGDTGHVVDTHIDFWLISEETNRHPWNNVNNNNSKNDTTPTLYTSEIYAWLNALKIDIVDNTAVPMTLTEVDHTEDGFLLSLPEALQAKIVERYGPLLACYNSSQMVSGVDNFGLWGSHGKLWLLTALEITGNIIFATNATCRWPVQYPFFTSNGRRKSPSTDPYWLLNGYTNATGFLMIEKTGYINSRTASSSSTSVYPCFRMAPTPEPEP